MRRLAGAVLVLSAATLLACGGEGGRSGAAACSPPDTSAAARVDPGRLSGEFALSMHVTAGVQEDSVVAGHLVLEPWAGARPDRGPQLPWIVEGRTTLTLTPSASPADSASPAVLSASDSASRDVVGFWDPRGRSIALVQGAVEDGGLQPVRGVDLRVLETGEDGFRGTWSTAFWGPPHPSGFFCARRVAGEDAAGRAGPTRRGLRGS